MCCCILFVLGSVELQLNFSRFGLTVVVPWSLPQDLQEDASEPRQTMKKIIRDKVGEISSAFILSLTSTYAENKSQKSVLTGVYVLSDIF